MSDRNGGRRGFLSALGAGLLLGAPGFLAGQTPVKERSRGSLEPWLEGMTGRHKQFFDVGGIADGKPLGRIANFIETYRTAYDLGTDQVNALFGAHSAGLSFVMSDALWSRFGIGRLYNVRDPDTHAPAMRNVFLDETHGATRLGLSPKASVTALMEQGVRFLACNNSISALAKLLAARGFGEPRSLERETANGLMPGVMIVPAMLIAGNRAQETGFTYSYLS